MPFSKLSLSQLSERFAELYQQSQDEYRDIHNALRDDGVPVPQFEQRVAQYSETLVNLKRIRTQITGERAGLRSDGQA